MYKLCLVHRFDGDPIEVLMYGPSAVIVVYKDMVLKFVMTKNPKRINEYTFQASGKIQIDKVLRVRISADIIIVVTEVGLCTYNERLELKHRIISDDINDGLIHGGNLHYVLGDGVVSIVTGEVDFESKLHKYENQVISYRNKIVTTKQTYDHYAPMGNSVLIASDLRSLFYGTEPDDMCEMESRIDASDIRVVADQYTLAICSVGKGRIVVMRRGDGLEFTTLLRYNLGTVYDSFPFTDTCISVCTAKKDLIFLTGTNSVYNLIPY